MKKIFAFLCVMALLLGLAACASAYSLKLPAGLKTIEAEAFYGDDSLEEIEFPRGVERIESKAFANTAVTEVYLPESIVYIADDAFDGVQNMKVKAVAASYPEFDSCETEETR